MASRRVDKEPASPKRAPATTPEGREGQMVALAVDLAEKQLREGSASSQVISHYLKLASSRESLEQERLKQENKLLEAKVQQLESQRRTEELYEEVIKAMREYSGQGSDEDYYED